jgi:curved DNA-binding protein
MRFEKDYYKILGIGKDATQEEIKSAYRRLALLNHPDRNRGDTEAEERFKEINEAYIVLGDKETREKYDRLNSLSSRQTHKPEDIYEDFGLGRMFRDFDLGFDENISPRFFYGRGRRCGRKRKFFRKRFFSSHSPEFDLPLTSSEAFFGTKKEVTLRSGWGVGKVLIEIPARMKDGSRLRVSARNRQSGLIESEFYLKIRIVEN